MLERASLLAQGDEIQPEDLYLDAGGSKPLPTGPYMAAKRAVLEAFEKDYLARSLEAQGGNVSRAAAAAGLDRKNFQVLMKKHGVKTRGVR